jgi:hypothetical protein
MDVTTRFPVMAGAVAALAGYVLVEIVPPLLQALGITLGGSEYER